MSYKLDGTPIPIDAVAGKSIGESTGAGGKPLEESNDTGSLDAEKSVVVKPLSGFGGRRSRSNGSRKNSWLSHVKATMKVNRDKSFKQVLKLAKKTYKKSKSQSQNGGKDKSKGKGKGKSNRKMTRGGSSMKQSIDALLQKQEGGSGMAGKAPFGESAAPVA